jgi:recombination protein RecA
MATHDIQKILNAFNKMEGVNAVTLAKRKGTEIPYWIPTGSLWLDSTICSGQMGGIPGGHITEIAGLPSSGKSYLAAQIMKNAQAMGKICVWYDSENAMEVAFLEKMGVDTSEIIYSPANSIEDVFESAEKTMRISNDVVFFLDSVANTPAKAEWEKTYDPSSQMAIQARAMSFGLRRIVNLLASTKSTFVLINQLKTNIGPTALSEPLVTPCGKAIQFNAHLRLFLTSRKAKVHNIYEGGAKVGSDLKVKIRKSRFGTEERECALQIMWGNGVRICDEESWFEAIQPSEYFERVGTWYNVYLDNERKEAVKFQKAKWMETLMGNERLQERVKWIITDELVAKFANKTLVVKTLDPPDDYIAEEEEM